MANYLVTGGAGFIGSNFIQLILKERSFSNVVNFDLLTYAGNLENHKDFKDDAHYVFEQGDIRDRKKVSEIFDKHKIDAVVNFAAESHVDRSIEDPEVFISTNILGTQVLLDIAKQKWKINTEDKYCRKFREGVKFLQVSTDEVYGDLGENGKFTEDMPLLPNSPYSSSKASADLIVRAYHKTYGIPVNITRCSNNYGPYQFPEKLIPLMIHNALNDKPLPVYGDGQQIRDWLHVYDHCRALLTVLRRGESGEIYNIGGNNEKANIDIVKIILQALNKSDTLITFVKDRPGHDRRYAIDNTKIIHKLGWKPEYSFEKGIKDTIEWYLSNPKWIENVVSGDYQTYYKRMYTQGINK